MRALGAGVEQEERCGVSTLNTLYSWPPLLTLTRRGHYGRALEDAISSHHSQWPTAWKGINPIHGGKNFNNMSAEERVRVALSSI
jgi:hypothetical protein